MEDKSMKVLKDKARKGQVESKVVPAASKETAALEPCGKPQAEEAARLKDSDEACDEGVH
jgi:hypothetical protein